MASRWERLLEQKPIALEEHLRREVAKLLGHDLAEWPLPILELDLGAGRAMVPLLEPGSKRPPEALFTEAFRLARWDLSREVDAYDDHMRNRRWLVPGLSEAHKPALLFVSRWLVEQMLGLGEATEGRVKRPQMRACLDEAERELLRLRSVASA